MPRELIKPIRRTLHLKILQIAKVPMSYYLERKTRTSPIDDTGFKYASYLMGN